MEAYKARPASFAATQRPLRGDALSDSAAAGQISSLRGLNARQVHQHVMRNYTLFYGGSANSQASHSLSQPVSTDMDALRGAHRFLWDEARDQGPKQGGGLKHLEQWGSEQAAATEKTWEQRLARRYYDALHKEYAIADMSRWREGGVGLRWRTEREVFEGKGQFTCGNKACAAEEGLASFEVNFGYVEHGEQRQALVKLRLCTLCARKLHHGTGRKRRREEEYGEERKQSKKAKRREKKREKKEEKERKEKRKKWRREGDGGDKGDGTQAGRHSRHSELEGRSDGSSSSEEESEEGRQERAREAERTSKSSTSSSAATAVNAIVERTAGRGGGQQGRHLAREPPAENFDTYYSRFVKDLLL